MTRSAVLARPARLARTARQALAAPRAPFAPLAPATPTSPAPLRLVPRTAPAPMPAARPDPIAEPPRFIERRRTPRAPGTGCSAGWPGRQDFTPLRLVATAAAAGSDLPSSVLPSVLPEGAARDEGMASAPAASVDHGPRLPRQPWRATPLMRAPLGPLLVLAVYVALALMVLSALLPLLDRA